MPTAPRPKRPPLEPVAETLVHGRDESAAAPWRGMTTWSRGSIQFIRTILGDHRIGTATLVAAMAGALLWANVAGGSYHWFWNLEAVAGIADHTVHLSLREVVNQGLMTFFFLVIGLEARREWDLGDLRDRRRSLLPLSIGLIALLVPAGIYALINLVSTGGHPGAWGIAMSTDTAMALGALSLLSGEASPRMRQFLITVLVADDIASLAVIAAVYSSNVRPVFLAAAASVLAVYWWLQKARAARPALIVVGFVAWLLTRAAGVDPILSGLVVGLSSPAYAPALRSLEHASRGMRSFREQPSVPAARATIVRLRTALSPNDKLQQQYGNFVSLLVVPLFALANLGIRLDPEVLHRAFEGPVTWGIIVGLLVGKPLAYVVVPWAWRALSQGRLVPPVEAGEVLTAGAVSSMGFTITVLVATTALHGAAFEDAVVGALVALLVAPLVATGASRLPRLLPASLSHALTRPGAPMLVDLASEINEHDHVRGRRDAGVTIVEYGDFQCPFCGRAESSLAAVLHELPADVRYVWRHLPLTDVHPGAWRAALASEAAGAQDAFWPMHDALLAHRVDLEDLDLVALAASLGLDTEKFVADIESGRTVKKVAADIESARLSDVAGTPTLFINGVRHRGDYSPEALLAAVRMILPKTDSRRRLEPTSDSPRE